MSLKDKYIDFSHRISDICSHISVRNDEGGAYIFALGLKETHTLQLRKIEDSFVVELWYGENSDVERVVGEPEFQDIDSAFKTAEEWLGRDNI